MSVKMLGIERTTGQPFQVTDGTIATFGNVIGATDSISSSNPQSHQMIQFPSGNCTDSGWTDVDLLFAFNGTNKIRVSKDGGSTWSDAYTLASGAPTNSYYAGFHPFTMNGEPRLALVYGISGSGHYCAIYNPTLATSMGSQWSAVSDTNPTPTSAAFYNAICYQNQIFWLTYDSDSPVHSFSPSLGQYTPYTVTYSGGSFYPNYSSFLVHEGELLLVATSWQSSVEYWTIYRLEAGAFVAKTSSISTTSGTIGPTCALHAQDGTLIVMASTGNATKGWSVDGSWNVSSLTLPSGLSSQTRRHMWSLRDRETNGPTGTCRSLLYVSNWYGSGNTGCYSVPDSSTFTDLGTFSGAYNLGLSWSNGGEGFNLWTSGEVVAFITSTTPISGGMKVTFRAYGGGTYALELLVEKRGFSSNPGTAPSGAFRGTMANPSAGSLTETNHKLTGLTADGTSYYVTWRSADDSVANGTWCEIRPVVTV